MLKLFHKLNARQTVDYKYDKTPPIIVTKITNKTIHRQACREMLKKIFLPKKLVESPLCPQLTT